MTESDAGAAFAHREAGGPLGRDVWEDAFTCVNLTVGRRAGVTSTAETGAVDGRDRR